MDELIRILEMTRPVPMWEQILVYTVGLLIGLIFSRKPSCDE